MSEERKILNDIMDKMTDMELAVKKILCLIEDIQSVDSKNQLRLYMAIDYAYEIVDAIKIIKPNFNILQSH